MWCFYAILHSNFTIFYKKIVQNLQMFYINFYMVLFFFIKSWGRLGGEEEEIGMPIHKGDLQKRGVSNSLILNMFKKVRVTTFTFS